MQFMAEWRVVLKLQVVDQIAMRYLQVMKYRRLQFAEKRLRRHRASGMEVADISAKTIAVEASLERVSSGVAPLDAMLARYTVVQRADHRSAGTGNPSWQALR